MRKDKIQSTSHSVYTGSGNYQLSWDLNLRKLDYKSIQVVLLFSWAKPSLSKVFLWTQNKTADERKHLKKQFLPGQKQGVNPIKENIPAGVPLRTQVFTMRKKDRASEIKDISVTFNHNSFPCLPVSFTVHFGKQRCDQSFFH